jgi:hypothetical protein
MNNRPRLRCFGWLLAMLLLLVSSRSFALDTVDWTEDALLHDGQTLKVSLRATNRVDASMPWPGYFNFQKSSLDTFRIEFRHPGTRARIVWEGIRGFPPILLDVLDGVPYLVVLGRPNKESSAVYGCPELPYIYLRYSVTGWNPIPVEQAPAELRKPNISVFDVWTGYEGRHFDTTEVARMLKVRELRGDRRIQDSIPRSYDEWKSPSKDGERNDRQFGDCRPPPPGLQDVQLPAPVDVELQLVEFVDVDDPENATSALRWKPRAQSQSNCNSALRIADSDNRIMGKRFTQDSTGSKVVPYAGPSPVRGHTMLDYRTFSYCDANYIWFVAAKEEVGKVHISKYARSGDLLYNVRFASPENLVPNLGSGMVLGTVEAEGESLTFYWSQSLPRVTLPNQSTRYPARLSKFRFTEPPATTLRE